MKNPGTLTGEVINSLLQLPLSLAACTPVLCWRNRRMHPALTSSIINDGEEWIISRGEIFKFWGKKVEHLLHLNKGWDGLSPCFAPVFFIVKCVSSVQRGGKGGWVDGFRGGYGGKHLQMMETCPRASEQENVWMTTDECVTGRR